MHLCYVAHALVRPVYAWSRVMFAWSRRLDCLGVKCTYLAASCAPSTKCWTTCSGQGILRKVLLLAEGKRTASLGREKEKLFAGLARGKFRKKALDGQINQTICTGSYDAPGRGLGLDDAPGRG